MNLAADRFYKGNFNYRVIQDGELHTAPMYSYETHGALYDIAVVNGGKLYRVNSGPWANTIDKIRPIHVEIERHFSI